MICYIFKFVVPVLILILFIWAFIIEPRLLFIKTYSIEDERLAGLKVAFVSDLHITPYNRVLMQRMVNTINTAKPDIILLGGDYIARRNAPPPNFMDELHALRAPLGLYAVLGNHDIGYRQQVTEGLRRAGIATLNNEAVRLQGKSGAFWLAGIDDMMRGNANVEKALANTRAPVILLSHSPEIHSSPFITDNVALIMSGHSHGGQLVLPFVGAPITNVDKAYNYGLIEKNNTRVLITRGLGLSIIPARFMCPPEVVILEFTAPAKK